MSDLLDAYLTGLERLIKQLEPDKEKQSLADTLGARLRANIEEINIHGTTETLRNEQSHILFELSKLTKETQGINFNQYCGLSVVSSSVFKPPSQIDDYLNSAHNYLTSACTYIMTMHEALRNALQLFSTEGDIWPLQCQNVISAFQKHPQPHAAENLTLSSLEGILYFVSEQVHELLQDIDNFSSYGREKSAKARNMRHEIREKLANFPQSLTVAIEHINMTGETLDPSYRCVLGTNHNNNMR